MARSSLGRSTLLSLPLYPPIVMARSSLGRSTLLSLPLYPPIVMARSSLGRSTLLSLPPLPTDSDGPLQSRPLDPPIAPPLPTDSDGSLQSRPLDPPIVPPLPTDSDGSLQSRPLDPPLVCAAAGRRRRRSLQVVDCAAVRLQSKQPGGGPQREPGAAQHPQTLALDVNVGQQTPAQREEPDQLLRRGGGGGESEAGIGGQRGQRGACDDELRDEAQRNEDSGLMSDVARRYAFSTCRISLFSVRPREDAGRVRDDTCTDAYNCRRENVFSM